MTQITRRFLEERLQEIKKKKAYLEQELKKIDDEISSHQETLKLIRYGHIEISTTGTRSELNRQEERVVQSGGEASGE